MYDFYLSGHENFAADRIAALQVIEAAPDVPRLAKENRKFLGRAVQFLAGEAGIGQFLDLGTGLPTRGNVHQVAQQVNPTARVVYVDNDPLQAGLCTRPFSSFLAWPWGVTGRSDVVTGWTERTAYALRTDNDVFAAHMDIGVRTVPSPASSCNRNASGPGSALGWFTPVRSCRR